MTVVAPQEPPLPPPSFPPPPRNATLTLPGGGQLVGMVNLPRGIDDDCHASFNLLLQLGPFLGAIECLVKVLNLCAWILEFVPAIPDVVKNPTKLIDKLSELPPIAKDVMKCVTDWSPIGICSFIKDVLTMVSNFLRCILDLLDSILQQQIGIQMKMGDAQGNPALMEVLQAAQECTDNMSQQAMNSMAPIFGILSAITPFLGMVGAGAIELPSVDDLTGGALEPVVQILRDLKSIIDAILDALPC